MPITIGSNPVSLRVQGELQRGTARLSKTYERLASGLRINSASDDAAGLSISQGLESDARVFQQGIRNANDGISALNIAEGAVQQLSDIVTRIRELAEQSANGVYSNVQREALDTEAQALREEYNRITSSTKFNDLNLINGDLEDLRIQVGYGVDGSIAFNLGSSLARLVGNGTFQAEDLLASARRPTDITVGDFDGDGVNDIAFSTQGSFTSLMLGNGDGTFQSEILDATISASEYNGSITSGDYNNDGHLDLAYESFVAGTVEIKLGNGDGTFQGAVSYTAGLPSGSGGGLRDIEQADFNNDGFLDLIVADQGARTVNVLMNNGNGTFAAFQSFAGPALSSFPIAGDINGDGNVDLAISSAAVPTQLGVFLGNGDGTFQSIITQTLAIQAGNSPLLVDVNNDGYADYLGVGPGGMQVSFGSATGTFSNTTTYALAGSITPGRADPMTAFDFNDDGNLDIAILQGQSNQIETFINNGDGTFSSVGTTAVSSEGDSTVAADFNGDNVLDLVTNDKLGMTLSISIANTDTATTLESFSLSSQSDSRNALTLMKQASDRISAELGDIGAVQTRLATAASNLFSARLNMLAANDRITSADIGEESASLVKESILQQGAARILASVNLLPELAVELLS